VITILKLILYDYDAISTNFSSHDVTVKWSNGAFGFHKFQIDSQCGTKPIEILREPRSKVLRFMWPEMA
jgi:hypothetical protein